ncbi:hypothetical protein LQW54_007974 [Pestalotiopsis sp. IQ-011]
MSNSGPMGPIKKVGSDDWLERLEVDMPKRPDDLEAMELAKEGVKSGFLAENTQTPTTGGRRGLRTVPFRRDTFEIVARAFNVHSSISRAISRADVPIFSHANAAMEDEYGVKQTTSVYNCRTTNAWEMDLGLTVTYFPECDLTFAVLFGCHISTEEEIIKRLTFARDDVFHPLLLPGIIAEIERRRHFYHVDNTIDEVEARIFDLEVRPDADEGIDAAEMAKLHKEKRSAWLNTTYTRNCLISWQVQLQNMVSEAEEFERSLEMEATPSRAFTWDSGPGEVDLPHRDEKMEPEQRKMDKNKTLDSPSTLVFHDGHREKMKATGSKITSRIRALIEEYDEKIRDCTMRIDGMAMATQWGMFSMTFFNWQNGEGEPIVSEYFWVYVVVTVFFTLMTRENVTRLGV